MQYIYERGEHRRKHCWASEVAGFWPSKRGAIGKCSSLIDDALGQKLLDDGVPYRDAETDPHPAAIYNVFQGVPYEAAPTRTGESFHGYPWRGRMPEAILDELRRRADASGYGRAFKKWLGQYEGQR